MKCCVNEQMNRPVIYELGHVLFRVAKVIRANYTALGHWPTSEILTL
jgi:hypothetical protein